MVKLNKSLFKRSIPISNGFRKYTFITKSGKTGVYMLGNDEFLTNDLCGKCGVFFVRGYNHSSAWFYCANCKKDTFIMKNKDAKKKSNLTIEEELLDLIDILHERIYKVVNDYRVGSYTIVKDKIDKIKEKIERQKSVTSKKLQTKNKSSS